MIEVEVKYRVPRELMEKIASKVLTLGGKFLGEEVQEDVYFQHPSRNFAVSDEALRVRRARGRVEVTYKGPRIDSRSKTREEIQVKVEDFNSFVSLLEKLGFKRVAKVVKKRKTYKFNDELLHLDCVEDAGFFVEIEGTVEDEGEIEGKREKLIMKAKELGIPTEGFELKSYLEIILGI